MNRYRVFVFAAAALSAALWAYACGDGTTEPPTPPPDPPRPTTVTVSPATAELPALGATVQLSAEVRDQNGQTMAGAAVTWASSAAEVAAVSNAGLVAAAGNGTATITATAGSASGSATITVAQEVSAVAVSPAADTLVAGDTLRLAAEAADANGHPVAEVEFSWASSDTLVSVVDTTGLVTGVGMGEVEITATSSGVAGHAELTVVAPAPTTIAVSPDSVALTALGQTVRLTAEVRDQVGRVMEGVPVSWSSADTTVAAVDSLGLVTAAGNGTATITATAGSASGSATITVAQEVSAVAVTPAADTLVAGDTLRLVAEAADANGHPVAEVEFSWASSDTLVAVVDDAGLVTGVGAGEAEVTATSSGMVGGATLVVVEPSRVALGSGAGSAPEGGVVTLGLTVDPVPESAIRVRYTLGVDGDPATADADLYDYTDSGGGAVEVAAGASSAVIEIAINDDDEIESGREVFTVTLDTPGGDAGYVLGVVATAAVTILEGVCDRTPQVRDEIVEEAGSRNCMGVGDSHLARIWVMSLFVGSRESEEARITVLREGDFAGLSSLRLLDLHGNALAELPPAIFSGLSSLRHLYLSGNKLTELPEGVFAGLSSLESLRLGDLNPGAPFLLTLAIERTDNPDPLAAGPAEVVVKLAEGAPFDISVELSALGVTLPDNSAQLSTGRHHERKCHDTGRGRRLAASVTVTAAPQMPSTLCYGDLGGVYLLDGARCYSGFMIAGGNPLILGNPDAVTLAAPASYLNQGIQNLNGGVPLIAGRQALLRVFATADHPNSFRPGARATFLVEGQEIYVADMEPPAGIPLEVDESRLERSFTATVPGQVLRPGVEMVVELDPDSVVPLKPGSVTRIPAAGRLSLDAQEVPPLSLTVVPVHYLSETNKVTNSTVAAFTAAFIEDWATNGSDGWLRETREILPINELDVKFREPYFTQADTAAGGDSYAYTILDEIRMLRHLEAANPDEYYHGFFAVKYLTEAEENEGYIAGLASLGGQVGITEVTDHNRSKAGRFSLGVFNHELGHNLGLWHARCDVAPSHPAYTPYADGSIGAWGHRFIDGDATGFGWLLDPEVYVDLMGADSCPQLATLSPGSGSATTTLHQGPRPSAGSCVGPIASFARRRGGAGNTAAVGRSSTKGSLQFGTRIRA